MGGLKRTEHGNQPFFSTEFKNIVHILTDFGNRDTGGHGHFYFERYLTDILKQLERISEIIPFRNSPSDVNLGARGKRGWGGGE